MQINHHRELQNLTSFETLVLCQWEQMNASSLKELDGRQCEELISRTNERKRCESQIIILDSPSNSQKLSSASSWACHASNACLSSSLNKIHTKNLILSFPRKVYFRNYTFHAPQSQSSARNTNILFYFIIFFLIVQQTLHIGVCSKSEKTKSWATLEDTSGKKKGYKKKEQGSI